MPIRVILMVLNSPVVNSSFLQLNCVQHQLDKKDWLYYGVDRAIQPQRLLNTFTRRQRFVGQSIYATIESQSNRETLWSGKAT